MEIVVSIFLLPWQWNDCSGCRVLFFNLVLSSGTRIEEPSLSLQIIMITWRPVNTPRAINWLNCTGQWDALLLSLKWNITECCVIDIRNSQRCFSVTPEAKSLYIRDGKKLLEKCVRNYEGKITFSLVIKGNDWKWECLKLRSTLSPRYFLWSNSSNNKKDGILPMSKKHHNTVREYFLSCFFINNYFIVVIK